MKSVVISLTEAELVKNFVNIVNQYDFDMDLRSGRFVVDAKSILGIFSLNLSAPLTLEIHSDKCDALIADLKKFSK
ncbi:MAG: HPr family phosphocarrier protein [Clostridia bacterium]